MRILDWFLINFQLEIVHIIWFNILKYLFFLFFVKKIKLYFIYKIIIFFFWNEAFKCKINLYCWAIFLSYKNVFKLRY